MNATDGAWWDSAGSSMRLSQGRSAPGAGERHILGGSSASAHPATAALAVLETIRQAVLVVDPKMKLTFANRKAAEILDAREGVSRCRDRLTALRPSDTERLRSAVQNLCAGRAAELAIALPRPSGRMPYAARLVPVSIRQDDPDSFRSAAIWLRDPERPERVREESLQSLYGLTPTQARLAALICGGMGPSEAGRQLGILPSTVKTHLGAIFEKTGTSRQAAMVARILGDLETGP